MTVKVSFADLTHTGQLVAANTFPLGISLVAAYAKEQLGDDIDFEVFKYPEDFSSYLENNTPDISCFSAYSWNIRLGHEYARRIKEISPETITVFGGPNFPGDKTEQQEFLAKYPAIDCYLEFEGEIAFVELFKSLKTFDFSWERFKQAEALVPNIRYLRNGEIIAGNLAPKITDLNILPSPYLTGVTDKFFDDVLIPIIQTTRGCPFTCSFCVEGGDYFQKTPRFTQERISQDLRYIAERVKLVPDLMITDANFGMFPKDFETAKELAAIQAEYGTGWPKSIITATAKNHKERTIKIVEILGETLPATAAVQSTDAGVLEQIRRTNVSQDALITFAKATAKQGGQTEAEVILCLEGDSKKAHFRTISDMLDADMTYIRMYQFMMLPGTQSSSKNSREKYEMEIKFRVLPRCFGTYEFRGTTFPVAEIEEIVVSNNTMPYEDYQACRDLHLSVEIFNNDSIFLEINNFLGSHSINRSEFIMAVHEFATGDGGVLQSLYNDFREEEKKNLWDQIEPVEEFVTGAGVIKQYVDGEYGTNELYKYRALAVFKEIDSLHQLAFTVARNLLASHGLMDEAADTYLSELSKFSLMRKRDLLNTKAPKQRRFHFDFPKLMDSKFTLSLPDISRPDGVEVEAYHSDEQCDLIDGYMKQYGDTLIGLGRLLVRANMNRLYRSARTLGSDDSTEMAVEEPVRTNLRSHANLIQ